MAMALWDPFRDLETLHREIDRAFAQVGGSTPARRWPVAFLPSRAPRMYPLVNVYDDGETFSVEALAPGLDPNKIDVTVVRDTVTIAGEKTPSPQCPPEKVHRGERAAGRFVRSLQLAADVDPNRVSAEYRNGILLLNVPRSESARPRRITVRAD